MNQVSENLNLQGYNPKNSPYAMGVAPFQMSCPSGEAMPGAKIKAYETRELLGRWEAQGYRDTCIPTAYPRVKIHGHCESLLS